MRSFFVFFKRTIRDAQRAVMAKGAKIGTSLREK